MPCSILYIEDDLNAVKLVEKVLTAAEYKFDFATNGIEGIEKACNQKYDLILLDILLPDIDGYEIVLNLRTYIHLQDIPIVAVTAHGDRGMALAVGCDGYISKPIDVKSLPKELESYLKGKKNVTVSESSQYLLAQAQQLSKKLYFKIQELIKANERLKHEEELRKQFYRNISHEMASPLTPILGYVEMLLNEDFGEINEVQRRTLQSIQRNVDKIRKIINDLLDVTALELGNVILFPKEFDLVKELKEAFHHWEKIAEKKKKNLIVHLPETNYKVFQDKEKLIKILDHIIDNSFKFTSINGTIIVEVDLREGFFEISIYDDGIGIPISEQDKVLEPFYQVDHRNSRNYGGVGIGLTLAYKNVKRLGGDFKLESPPSSPHNSIGKKGTLVKISFPSRLNKEKS